MEDQPLLTRREMVTAFLALPLVDLDHYQPVFFSTQEFEALQAFTEILIPTDETPGAREAHCAQYIDFVLASSSETPTVQTQWHTALQSIRDTGFFTADAARRLTLLEEMSRAETPPFRLLKRQTAFAFYTSRVGTIQTLDYKGNSYNMVFPACTHPDHQVV